MISLGVYCRRAADRDHPDHFCSIKIVFGNRRGDIVCISCPDTAPLAGSSGRTERKTETVISSVIVCRCVISGKHQTGFRCEACARERLITGRSWLSERTNFVSPALESKVVNNVRRAARCSEVQREAI